jgi:glycosyltransferase involved in cell wall biosynthesis
VHVVNCPAERGRRGDRAAVVARERYSWPALAGEIAAVYDAARSGLGGLVAPT